MKNIDTIYSPRKFFGVSDGGYLYTNHYLDQFLEKDVSSYSSRQLLGRIDKSATLFYADYQKSEERHAILAQGLYNEYEKLTLIG